MPPLTTLFLSIVCRLFLSDLEFTTAGPLIEGNQNKKLPHQPNFAAPFLLTLLFLCYTTTLLPPTSSLSSSSLLPLQDLPRRLPSDGRDALGPLPKDDASASTSCAAFVLHGRCPNKRHTVQQHTRPHRRTAAPPAWWSGAGLCEVSTSLGQGSPTAGFLYRHWSL